MEDLIVKVGEKEFEAMFDKNDMSHIVVNNNTYHIELLKEIADNIHSLSVNQKVVQIEFDMEQDGNNTIYLDGLAFDVEYTDATRKMIHQFIKAAGAGEDSGIIKITAPMPGMVVKVMVEEGTEVKKDDSIIIVEAMKMENALKSPGSGIVKSVRVKEGQAVEKDALMIEIEAERQNQD